MLTAYLNTIIDSVKPPKCISIVRSVHLDADFFFLKLVPF